MSAVDILQLVYVSLQNSLIDKILIYIFFLQVR